MDIILLDTYFTALVYPTGVWLKRNSSLLQDPQEFTGQRRIKRFMPYCIRPQIRYYKPSLPFNLYIRFSVMEQVAEGTYRELQWLNGAHSRTSTTPSGVLSYWCHQV